MWKQSLGMVRFWNLMQRKKSVSLDLLVKNYCHLPITFLMKAEDMRTALQLLPWPQWKRLRVYHLPLLVHLLILQNNREPNFWLRDGGGGVGREDVVTLVHLPAPVKSISCSIVFLASYLTALLISTRELVQIAVWVVNVCEYLYANFGYLIVWLTRVTH